MTEFINQVDFDFIFKNINYKVKLEKKKLGDPDEKFILKNVNGYCKSGEITAIMGPSGSGKTSLLNFLTNRIEFPKNSEHSGDLFVNSDKIEKAQLSKMSSYVMQDDLMFDILSPRETLTLAAKMRYRLPEDQINEKISILLEDLKLGKCADTRIGNDIVKGISGGEKKRVSIGIEILSNPHIFFLDEPTSGLDSKTSLIIIEFLKELAKKYKKAVIFTIHQPSSNIVMLFHTLILLNKGELVYQGNNKGILNHFEKVGYSLGDKANPADAFMHKIEILNHKKDTILTDKYKEIQQEEIEKEIEQRINSGKSGKLSEKNLENSGFCKAFNLLLYRAFLNQVRNPMLFRLRVFMTLMFSFLTCSIFCFLSKGPTGVGNRSGFFFFFCVNNFMQNIFNTVTTFPLERSIFLREYASNLYDVIPYFMGKSLIETPIGFFFTLIYSSICYYIVGLRIEPQYFFTFLCVYISLVFLAQGMGLLFGCAFTNFSTAMVVTQFSVMPAFLFSGFLINQENMPVWLSWIRFLSPFRYALEAALRNEFDGVDPNEFNGVNPAIQLNLDIGMWNCVYIMLGMGLAYRIMACILLKTLVRKVG